MSESVMPAKGPTIVCTGCEQKKPVKLSSMGCYLCEAAETKVAEQAKTIADLSLLLSHRELLSERLTAELWKSRQAIVDKIHDGSEYELVLGIDAALSKQEPK